MVSKSRLLLITAVVIVAAAAILLPATKYFLTPKHGQVPRHLRPPPGAILLPGISYGALYCNHLIIIPGNSMIILHYHVHGNVSTDGVMIYMAFPAYLINESLAAFSRLSNPNGAMWLGVYVDGRLIAVNDVPTPVLGLVKSVSIPYIYGNQSVTFWQMLRMRNETNTLVEYTSYGVFFPTINLTPSDTLVVILYSAVPYALSSCKVANESEEAELMVRNGWIGVWPTSNATQAAEQLYVEGRYITEEPVIYIINATKPITKPPQELTPSLLANARPFATGYAPSFAMGAPLTQSTLIQPIGKG